MAECKNVRESGKVASGEAYREGGQIVAYKVETQKTRAATGDPTSRYYGADQFHILGVCSWEKRPAIGQDFMFARAVDLTQHGTHAGKLSVFQRVPLPSAINVQPWYASLAELLEHMLGPAAPMKPLYKTDLGESFCSHDSFGVPAVAARLQASILS